MYSDLCVLMFISLQLRSINCFNFVVHNGLFVMEILRFWGLDLGPFQTEKLFGAALFNHKLVWSSVLKIGRTSRCLGARRVPTPR